MEMVQVKVALLAGLVALTCSCAGTPSVTWEKFVIDGHMTGVTPVTSEDIAACLGTVENGIYTSPSGKVFTEGATPLVAADMISVQPQLAELKTVIAYAPEEMARTYPESELGNFLVDHMMAEVAAATGKRVDVGIINRGGVRVDLPQGNILLEDVQSMLPFKNYPCYVRISGKDLLNIFQFLAEDGVQIFGGARMVVKDHKLESVTVSGSEIVPGKDYGVATLDFLLDGGDGLYVARNAKELLVMDKKFSDVIIPCIRKITENGGNLEYFKDGRVQIND